MTNIGIVWSQADWLIALARKNWNNPSNIDSSVSPSEKARVLEEFRPVFDKILSKTESKANNLIFNINWDEIEQSLNNSSNSPAVEKKILDVARNVSLITDLYI